MLATTQLSAENDHQNPSDHTPLRLSPKLQMCYCFDLCLYCISSRLNCLFCHFAAKHYGIPYPRLVSAYFYVCLLFQPCDAVTVSVCSLPEAVLQPNGRDFPANIIFWLDGVKTRIKVAMNAKDHQCMYALWHSMYII